MPREISLIVGNAGMMAARAAELIVRSATADIYVGPPPIVLTSKREEPIIPDIDLRALKEPKKRDWEQRNRKRRR